MRRSTNSLKAGAILCAFLLLYPRSLMIAQTADPAPVLSADQLDDLVAPIALYPDELLGQVLAASTYPLEVVEAQQWIQQNRALQGRQLMDAARRQSWDPSVQAMVAFPNVLALLNRDIRWTTDLGNAFLAQQADVMNAVQRLRSRARGNGRLVSTPQQTVTEANGAVEIQPANPQIVYVPTYNPAYVWGAPAWGAYPALGYPDTGYGFGFNPGVLISAIFSGLLSFTGWGWGLNWLAHALFLNNLFFGHFGFGSGYGGAWVHNPGHRLGVAYPNHAVASRFSAGHTYAGRAVSSNARAYTSRAYNSASTSRSYSAPRAEVARSYNTGSTARSYNRSAESRPASRPNQSYRSPSSSSYRAESHSARSASSHYSAPKAPKASHMKAPHMSAPKGHSGGHSGGGHSSKHK